MHFGQYKKKIYKTIFFLGMMVSLLITLLSASAFSAKRKNEYLRHLSSASSMLETNSSVAMTIIMNAVQEVAGSESLDSLTGAQTYPEFLYHSLQVSGQIRKSTAGLNAVDYALFVSMLNPPVLQKQEMDYVISNNSANQISEFADRIPGFTPEVLDEVRRYFETNSKPLLLPQYEQDSIGNFFYFTVKTIQRQPFLFIVTIPPYTLLGETPALCSVVYDADGIVACHASSDFCADFNHLHKKLIDHARNTNHFYLEGNPVITATITGTPWKIAYIYESLDYSGGDLLLFGISLCVFLFIGMWLMKIISDRLYQPVKEVIRDTISPHELSEIKDEFELIRQNNAKIQDLSGQLQEMTQANDKLISQQSYRELLFSKTVKPEYSDSFLCMEKHYCVALFDLTSDQETFGSIPVQNGILYDYALMTPSAHYVSASQNHSCLILQCDTLAEAKNILFAALHKLTTPESLENTEPYVALSRIHPGPGSLHQCYCEAVKILDYRMLFPTAKIITYEQIEPYDTIVYSYPLSTENKLVQYTLNGKIEAVQLFDDLIRDNIRDKNLPASAMQNLIYALIGTLIRIFAELKTTPEEFLTEPIDFPYFYDNWNKPATITMIKSTLGKIIAAVNHSKSTSDQELCQQMLQYIYDNYWDNIMLNDMADHFNISPKYCGILFKELSDNNFKNFLNHYRIEKAKEMLEQDSSVKIQDLGRLVGFNSPNSFLRVFRKYTGLTPTEYIERVIQQEHGKRL